jgi:DNA-directed RNA polymerase specialized sigma subunit
LDGRFWLVRVPAIDRSTQARTFREIPDMAKDLITIMTGEEEPTIEVRVTLPEMIEARISHINELRREEASARAQAAAESRFVAWTLRQQSLTLADVGAVLGVSHQRAQQLIAEAEEPENQIIHSY